MNSKRSNSPSNYPAKSIATPSVQTIPVEDKKPEVARPNSTASSTGWLCEICLVRNVASAAQCVSCESKRDTTVASTVGWTGDLCLVSECASVAHCCCETTWFDGTPHQPAQHAQATKHGRSRATSITAPSVNTIPVTAKKPGHSDVAISSAGCTCESCMVTNDASALQCVCCEVKRSASPGYPQQLKRKVSNNQWICNSYY
ncbi:hypothetical protein BDR26DRAFT_290637 [Obelidium mucronatum]|nr:hypothetical protein BDR26DRAFT_290637 [Obelidium mucronatum]